MKVTYYLEVVSSWCHWVEPTWVELQKRYAGRVAFDWKIALMKAEDFPVSAEQCDWFYRRSGMIMRSPYMLNSGWHEVELRGNYSAPNLVIEAARGYTGGEGDDVRLAIAHAAMREGRKVGHMAEAVAVAASVLGVNEEGLRVAAESKAVRDRVEASTAEFLSHQISQRPAFVLSSEIGDKAVFSGVVRIEPLVATIDAMLADAAAYTAYREHFGKPPVV